METRIFTDIEVVNRVWVESYVIESIEAFDAEVLQITGDRGNPEYLRIDIQFIAPHYIACATWFEGEVRWRMASEQETQMVCLAYTDSGQTNVYCIEENFEAFTPHPPREPRKFFVAAGSVQIRVSYGGDNIDELLKLNKFK